MFLPFYNHIVWNTAHNIWPFQLLTIYNSSKDLNLDHLEARILSNVVRQPILFQITCLSRHMNLLENIRNSTFARTRKLQLFSALGYNTAIVSRL